MKGPRHPRHEVPPVLWLILPLAALFLWSMM
jgi:hypothetical protein